MYLAGKLHGNTVKGNLPMKAFCSLCWVGLVVLALVTAPGSTARGQNVSAGPQQTFEFRGVWAGVAFLDEALLKAKYDALTDQAAKDAFITKAEAFLSAVAAFQFKADGRYESEVEMFNIAGEVERAKTSGQYRILESDGPKFIVEFIEISEEGPSEKEKRLIQFYEDGQHFAVLVPAPEEFQDCNPLMVFERVPDEALSAQESIAQDPNQTRIK